MLLPILLVLIVLVGAFVMARVSRRRKERASLQQPPLKEETTLEAATSSALATAPPISLTLTIEASEERAGLKRISIR